MWPGMPYLETRYLIASFFPTRFSRYFQLFPIFFSLRVYFFKSNTFPADYLVTGDKDLLVLRNHQSTLIITFTEFISMVQGLS